MISREETEKIAFELYEKSGRVDGFDQEHWFEAERIVAARKARKNSDVKPAGRRAVAAGEGSARPRKTQRKMPDTARA
jgi:hypothetical protein